ncbi:MAG: TetM/TetW/TetO/TetS family tetracycline resistance ribosomal protection protein [Clostridia bacterium]|nr:TetM/TetW/TetO/TetS family tetracycline resistance ribosomal protection protein [Clostridia bacterium]
MPVRNIGIFAHVDAGKTTLSEQMLLHAGAIRQAGSVDRGTAHTDDLPVERRRGISVKATCVSLTWRNVDIRLIDTPGHTDFSAEIERSFWALDAGILVIDAVQGIQSQTEILMKAFLEQGLPLLIFLNKTDRPGADPQRVLSEIRKRLAPEAVPLWNPTEVTEFVCAAEEGLLTRYLNDDIPSEEEIHARLKALVCEGRAFPVLQGSALRDTGIELLLDSVLDYLPEPSPGNGTLCGVAFSAVQDRLMGRGVWVRLFSGRMENRMPLEIEEGADRLTGEKILGQRKISQIRDAAGRDLGEIKAGDVGIIYGLGDVKIGYVFGTGEMLPRKVNPGHFRTPLITVQVIPRDPGQTQALREACGELTGEDPLLHAGYERESGEIHLQVMGKVQLEILQEVLESRFGIPVSFGDPSVIYQETIRNRATGFVAYTMPKPCWAVLEFDIEPGPRGSGVTFSSTVPGKDIMPRYQHQVEQALPMALSQGRLGWNVTDLKITLVGGNHHLIHTHPLDFIVATPMAVQDGLRRGGSILLEPILEMRFVLPPENAGRVMNDVRQMRGEVTDTRISEDFAELTALVPAAASMDYPTQFASLTGGRGSMSSSLHSYRECPLELGKTARRRGTDPLDTARYILAARSALEGDIFG